MSRSGKSIFNVTSVEEVDVIPLLYSVELKDIEAVS